MSNLVHINTLAPKLYHFEKISSEFVKGITMNYKVLFVRVKERENKESSYCCKITKNAKCVSSLSVILRDKNLHHQIPERDLFHTVTENFAKTFP